MNKKFNHIGLITRAGKNTVDTLIAVKAYCLDNAIALSVEQKTAEIMHESTLPLFSEDKLPGNIDLMIVVGGDGSLLHAAHCALDHDLPVLGINRGHLGFLTDINPSELHRIGDVLNGNYTREERFLLKTSLGIALNDIVLLPGEAQLIEFDIMINNQFVCQQRADGLIIATPTGSTAYALSGGGPILHPNLNAMVLVPMFPHTLSSRPIVVDSDAKIELIISEHKNKTANISCDGQKRISVQPGTRITIEKHEKKLQLIHPGNYDYFATLREKLGWQSHR
jgi:NAD+ kinase